MMSKRLNILTPTERTVVFVPGTKLSYEDMSNPRTVYTITEIVTDRWGTHAELKDDESNRHTLSLSGGFQQGWKLVS